MDDEMIKLLAKRGGVIQINFGSMFVSGRVSKEFADRRKHIAEYIEARNLDDKQEDEYVRRYMEEHAIGDADISDVVANIDHVAQLVGIDHIGLGSDFDGVGGKLPKGLEDVSCYPNLIHELLKKGYTEEDIKKICSDNFLRAWSAVEETALELQSGK